LLCVFISAARSEAGCVLPISGAEEPLVDTANIWRRSSARRRTSFNADEFYRVFEEAPGARSQPRSKNAEGQRRSERHRNANGIVLFDSDSRETIGQDFRVARR
jgi:hypothetical protein